MFVICLVIVAVVFVYLVYPFTKDLGLAEGTTTSPAARSLESSVGQTDLSRQEQTTPDQQSSLTGSEAEDRRKEKEKPLDPCSQTQKGMDVKEDWETETPKAKEKLGFWGRLGSKRKSKKEKKPDAGHKVRYIDSEQPAKLKVERLKSDRKAPPELGPFEHKPGEQERDDDEAFEPLQRQPSGRQKKGGDRERKSSVGEKDRRSFGGKEDVTPSPTDARTSLILPPSPAVDALTDIPFTEFQFERNENESPRLSSFGTFNDPAPVTRDAFDRKTHDRRSLPASFKVRGRRDEPHKKGDDRMDTEKDSFRRRNPQEKGALVQRPDEGQMQLHRSRDGRTDTYTVQQETYYIEAGEFSATRTVEKVKTVAVHNFGPKSAKPTLPPALPPSAPRQEAPADSPDGHWNKDPPYPAVAAATGVPRIPPGQQHQTPQGWQPLDDDQRSGSGRKRPGEAWNDGDDDDEDTDFVYDSTFDTFDDFDEDRTPPASVDGEEQWPVDIGVKDQPYSGQPYRDQPHIGHFNKEQTRRDQPYRDRPQGDQYNRDQPRKDQPYKDQTQRDQSNRDQPRRNQPQRDTPNRDQTNRDQPYKDQPYRDQPQRDQSNRDQSNRDQPRRDQPYRDQPQKDQPQRDQPYQDKRPRLEEAPVVRRSQPVPEKRPGSTVKKPSVTAPEPPVERHAPTTPLDKKPPEPAKEKHPTKPTVRPPEPPVRREEPPGKPPNISAEKNPVIPSDIKVAEPANVISIPKPTVKPPEPPVDKTAPTLATEKTAREPSTERVRPKPPVRQSERPTENVTLKPTVKPPEPPIERPSPKPVVQPPHLPVETFPSKPIEDQSVEPPPHKYQLKPTRKAPEPPTNKDRAKPTVKPYQLPAEQSREEEKLSPEPITENRRPSSEIFPSRPPLEKNTPKSLTEKHSPKPLVISAEKVPPRPTLDIKQSGDKPSEPVKTKTPTDEPISLKPILKDKAPETLMDKGSPVITIKKATPQLSVEKNPAKPVKENNVLSVEPAQREIEVSPKLNTEQFKTDNPIDATSNKPKKSTEKESPKLTVEKPKPAVEKPAKVTVEKPSKLTVEKTPKVTVEKPLEIAEEKPPKLNVEKAPKVNVKKPQEVTEEKLPQLTVEKPPKRISEKNHKENLVETQPTKSSAQKPSKPTTEKPQKRTVKPKDENKPQEVLAETTQAESPADKPKKPTAEKPQKPTKGKLEKPTIGKKPQEPLIEAKPADLLVQEPPTMAAETPSKESVENKSKPKAERKAHTAPSESPVEKITKSILDKKPDIPSVDKPSKQTAEKTPKHAAEKTPKQENNKLTEAAADKPPFIEKPKPKKEKIREEPEAGQPFIPELQNKTPELSLEKLPKQTKENKVLESPTVASPKLTLGRKQAEFPVKKEEKLKTPEPATENYLPKIVEPKKPVIVKPFHLDKPPFPSEGKYPAKPDVALKASDVKPAVTSPAKPVAEKPPFLSEGRYPTKPEVGLKAPEVKPAVTSPVKPVAEKPPFPSEGRYPTKPEVGLKAPGVKPAVTSPAKPTIEKPSLELYPGPKRPEPAAKKKPEPLAKVPSDSSTSSWSEEDMSPPPPTPILSPAPPLPVRPPPPVEMMETDLDDIPFIGDEVEGPPAVMLPAKLQPSKAVAMERPRDDRHQRPSTLPPPLPPPSLPVAAPIAKFEDDDDEFESPPPARSGKGPVAEDRARPVFRPPPPPPLETPFEQDDEGSTQTLPMRSPFVTPPTPIDREDAGIFPPPQHMGLDLTPFKPPSMRASPVSDFDSLDWSDDEEDLGDYRVKGPEPVKSVENKKQPLRPTPLSAPMAKDEFEDELGEFLPPTKPKESKTKKPSSPQAFKPPSPNIHVPTVVRPSENDKTPQPDDHYSLPLRDNNKLKLEDVHIQPKNDKHKVKPQNEYSLPVKVPETELCLPAKDETKLKPREEYSIPAMGKNKPKPEDEYSLPMKDAKNLEPEDEYSLPAKDKKKPKPEDEYSLPVKDKKKPKSKDEYSRPMNDKKVEKKFKPEDEYSLPMKDKKKTKPEDEYSLPVKDENKPPPKFEYSLPLKEEKKKPEDEYFLPIKDKKKPKPEDEYSLPVKYNKKPTPEDEYSLPLKDRKKPKPEDEDSLPVKDENKPPPKVEYSLPVKEEKKKPEDEYFLPITDKKKSKPEDEYFLPIKDKKKPKQEDEYSLPQKDKKKTKPDDEYPFPVKDKNKSKHDARDMLPLKDEIKDRESENKQLQAVPVSTVMAPPVSVRDIIPGPSQGNTKDKPDRRKHRPAESAAADKYQVPDLGRPDDDFFPRNKTSESPAELQPVEGKGTPDTKVSKDAKPEKEHRAKKNLPKVLAKAPPEVRGENPDRAKQENRVLPEKVKNVKLGPDGKKKDDRLIYEQLIFHNPNSPLPAEEKPQPVDEKPAPREEKTHPMEKKPHLAKEKPQTDSEEEFETPDSSPGLRRHPIKVPEKKSDKEKAPRQKSKENPDIPEPAVKKGKEPSTYDKEEPRDDKDPMQPLDNWQPLPYVSKAPSTLPAMPTKVDTEKPKQGKQRGKRYHSDDEEEEEEEFPPPPEELLNPSTELLPEIDFIMPAKQPESLTLQTKPKSKAKEDDKRPKHETLIDDYLPVEKENKKKDPERKEPKTERDKKDTKVKPIEKDSNKEPLLDSNKQPEKKESKKEPKVKDRKDKDSRKEPKSEKEKDHGRFPYDDKKRPSDSPRDNKEKNRKPTLSTSDGESDESKNKEPVAPKNKVRDKNKMSPDEKKKPSETPTEKKDRTHKPAYDSEDDSDDSYIYPTKPDTVDSKKLPEKKNSKKEPKKKDSKEEPVKLKEPEQKPYDEKKKAGDKRKNKKEKPNKPDYDSQDESDDHNIYPSKPDKTDSKSKPAKDPSRQEPEKIKTKEKPKNNSRNPTYDSESEPEEDDYIYPTKQPDKKSSKIPSKETSLDDDKPPKEKRKSFTQKPAKETKLDDMIPPPDKIKPSFKQPLKETDLDDEKPPRDKSKRNKHPRETEINDEAPNDKENRRKQPSKKSKEKKDLVPSPRYDSEEDYHSAKDSPKADRYDKRPHGDRDRRPDEKIPKNKKPDDKKKKDNHSFDDSFDDRPYEDLIRPENKKDDVRRPKEEDDRKRPKRGDDRRDLEREPGRQEEKQKSAGSEKRPDDRRPKHDLEDSYDRSWSPKQNRRDNLYDRRPRDDRKPRYDDDDDYEDSPRQPQKKDHRPGEDRRPRYDDDYDDYRRPPKSKDRRPERDNYYDDRKPRYSDDDDDYYDRRPRYPEGEDYRRSPKGPGRPDDVTLRHPEKTGKGSPESSKRKPSERESGKYDRPWDLEPLPMPFRPGDSEDYYRPPPTPKSPNPYEPITPQQITPKSQATPVENKRKPRSSSTPTTPSSPRTPPHHCHGHDKGKCPIESPYDTSPKKGKSPSNVGSLNDSRSPAEDEPKKDRFSRFRYSSRYSLNSLPGQQRTPPKALDSTDQKTNADDITSVYSSMMDVAVDPLMGEPWPTFFTIPWDEGDVHHPDITAIASTPHGVLFMTDYANKKIKAIDINEPNYIAGALVIPEQPVDMTLLYDNRLAVATNTTTIHILRIGANHVSLEDERRLQTDRKYQTIAGCPDDDYLIVSSGVDVKDGTFYPATVDIIDRRGGFVRTLVTREDLPGFGLEIPCNMCVDEEVNEVIISNWMANAIHMVNISSGKVEEHLTNDLLKVPKQMCVDDAGNVYVACWSSQCVLVKSRDQGWLRLIDGHVHSKHGFHRPRAVCHTPGGVIVVWSMLKRNETIVIGYRLVTGLEGQPDTPEAMSTVSKDNRSFAF